MKDDMRGQLEEGKKVTSREIEEHRDIDYILSIQDDL